MKRSLSIDFGSSYTKVALRCEPDKPSDIVNDKALNLDEGNFCIPSLVTLDERKGTREWFPGIRAVNSVPGNGITVFRNWKKDFFSTQQSVAVSSEPNKTPATVEMGSVRRNRVDAALQILDQLSVERELLIKSIAVRKKLSVKDVTRIVDEEDLSLEELREAAKPVVVPTAKIAPIGSGLANGTAIPVNAALCHLLQLDAPKNEVELAEVALEYFKWLRVFLEPHCKKRGIPDLNELPARICVPAFVHPMSSVGSSSLQEKLMGVIQEAGFCVDERYPTVTEPFANAIGVLTEGRNKTWSPSKGIIDMHMPSMFGAGTFLQKVKELSGEYVVLVVDIGAFTTDFAVLEFNTKDFEDRPRIADLSESLGMDQLDQEIQALLPQEKATLIGNLNLRDYERYKEIVYKQGACTLNKGIKIGAGEEKKHIQDCIHGFGTRIAECIDKFLDSHHFGHINEVLLTGGGNLVPAIRSTLRTHLQKRSDNGETTFHGNWSPTELSVKTNHRIDSRLIRAGSALGAASVYLDFMV